METGERRGLNVMEKYGEYMVIYEQANVRLILKINSA
jgi:hypothetical protein